MPSFSELKEQYNEDVTKLINTLAVDTRSQDEEERETTLYIEEYEGERSRRIKSVGQRKDKTINLYKENDKGEMVSNGTKTIYATRLVYPFPRKIVRTATHFLFGGRMVISANDTSDAFIEFKKRWTRELKMQSVLKKLARTCMIETKAALVFYPQPVSGDSNKMLKLRVKLLNNKSGEFYPHYDDYDDMDAFLWKYKVKADGKDVTKAKIYTAEKIYSYIQSGGSFQPDEKPEVENRFKKIPVVYVEQMTPEWEEVASLIDDYETRMSRLADTNDYMGEPLLKIYGKVNKFPDKDEVGKVVEFEMRDTGEGRSSHGDAEYVTWDHTPESIKLELESIWDGIFSMTSTPDLSFNNVKGIGSLSGIALKLMFMDAFIKREDKMEIFGPALSRCISVVTAGIEGYTNIRFADDQALDDINITFDDQLPSDVKELIETLSTATGMKPILSQETAAGLNPFTEDAEEEIQRIRDEETPGIPNETTNFNEI